MRSVSPPIQEPADGATARAVFFDRDGVLIFDQGYLSDIAAVRWIDGAKDALKNLANKGYLLFVVTNQSGVARGFFKEDAVMRVHEFMQAALPETSQITEFAYCPHHPEGPVSRYAQLCDCRKPAPGMINMLIERHRINRGQSFLIGDKQSDLEAAARADIDGFLFRGGNLNSFVQDILGQK